jgi:hypothetical protein
MHIAEKERVNECEVLLTVKRRAMSRKSSLLPEERRDMQYLLSSINTPHFAALRVPRVISYRSAY